MACRRRQKPVRCGKPSSRSMGDRNLILRFCSAVPLETTSNWGDFFMTLSSQRLRSGNIWLQ